MTLLQINLLHINSFTFANNKIRKKKSAKDVAIQ